MSPDKKDVLDFQHGQWLKHPLTDFMITNLIRLRTQKHLHAERLAVNTPNSPLISVYILQAQTLGEIISYATTNNYPTSA